MISPARGVAYELLCRIELQSAFSDFVLSSSVMDRIEARDRNLTTEIVYGTLRWRGFLDFLLQWASSRPWDKVAPEIQIILRMSLYQMWGMRRIPDHALIHDAVELSKQHLKTGVASFVNGVLRHLSRERPWFKEQFEEGCPPWVRVSLPEWLWDRWSERFGPARAQDYARYLNRPPRTAYRLQDSCSIEDGTSSRLPEGSEPSELVPGAILAGKGSRREPGKFAGPTILIQDEASQLIPYLLGPISDYAVWDTCAAPGGKSSILTALCGPGGWVVSTDLHFKRAKRLRNTLRTSRGARADVAVVDATRRAPFLRPFDAVLADVPCSGLGTIRRNPEIKWRLNPKRLRRLSNIQRRILESASEAVRAGGFLLYSTCSTEPEENECVIESFMRLHPSFHLVKPSFPPGVEVWLGSDGMLRTFPSSRLWDGFFAALLARDA